MAETLNPNLVSINLNSAGWAGATAYGHVFRVPSAGHAGGVTIGTAEAVNAAATNAGTGFTLTLENWGTAGTAIKASGGTIAAAIGGTGDPWVADTPKAFTLSNAYLDAGEWVVLKKIETNSSDPTRAVVFIELLSGK